MTFKKSMISIAAASVIAAGLTGCGSSGSTAAVVAAAEDTTTAGTVTSIKVVDGEVINAEATVTYLKEDNTTGEVAITDRANWLATSIDQNGTSTYDISEVNATVLDNLISVKFETKAAHESNGTIYGPTFFDTNGNGIMDGSETLAGNLELNTPAGFSVATPITTLVASMVNNADINESNRTALVAQALEDIAESLGLDATDISSVDPLTATDKPQYAAINALLGAVTRVGNDTAVKALATALAAKAAPANTSAAFGNLAAAATTAGETDSATMFTAFEVALEADSNMLDGALTMDLDALRKDSLADGSVQISYQTSAATDYNVTEVEIGTSATPSDGQNHDSSLVQNGAKIGDLNIKLEMLADGNITTNTIALVLKVANEKASVEADANLTQLTVYLPIDINATEGVITASLNPSALISYEGVTAAGTIKSGEANASALGLTASSIVTNNLNVGHSDKYSLDINGDSLISGIDSNMSNVFDLDLSSVASVQAALVDTDAITQKVSGDATDGYNTSYWGTTTVSSITGAITKTGKTILNLTGDKLADMRATFSGENAESNVTNVDVNGSGASAGTGFTTTYAYADAAKFTQMMNVATYSETNEVNNSVSISGLPTFITAAKSTIVAAAASTTADFNLTVDTNLSTMVDTNTTVALKVTDEFGKVNTTDANVSFFFDAIPTLATTNVKVRNFTKVDSTHYTADINATDINNTAVVFTMTNVMGEANTTFTESGDAVHALDLNSTAGTATWTITDINATTVASDENITFTPVTSAQKIFLDLNVSN